ncbi:MAG: DUF2935 domain-containing protein [Bacillota bacterium]|jgi:hypothetical protein|nr:DUF2935 domain-containing protein [Bacillota bacterium]
MPAGISVCEIVTTPVACSERNLSYWLRIMMEHAIFIENGLPAERVDLRAQAAQFQETFRSLLNWSGCMNAMAPPEAAQYLQNVREAVVAFLAFKRMLLGLALNCTVGGLGGYNYPLLLDHIAREAQLFLHALDTSGAPAGSPFEFALGEEMFWLRIMTDHAKFIASLLDQSERGFVQQAREFSQLFDRLLRQAQDYTSMLQADPSQFPVVARFTDEVMAETERIRDFKRAAHQLLLGCKILSILPPLLADHVAREAEHFLEVLQEIRGALPA